MATKKQLASSNRISTALRKVTGASVERSWAGPMMGPSSGGGGQAGDVRHYPPRWYSPLLSFVNYYIPWDRATLYQMVRYYDTFHPLVGNAIDLHTQLPLSRFSLKGIKDSAIRVFYEDMMDELDGFNLIYDMMREYWLLAEVFTFLNWDDKIGAFTNAEILMPEYVDVKGHPIVGRGFESYSYFLIPDQQMIQFVGSSEPWAENLKKHISPKLIEAISQGKNLEVDAFNMMVLMRKQSRYNIRGTSIILRCFQDLIYESRLREAQYSIAQRLITPKEIWKIGSERFPPTQTQINNMSELIQKAEQQELFTLVTHWAVALEYVGAVGKFPNLGNEFDWIEKRILTGLFTNKSLTHGEGPNYANSSVAARALMMRYMPVRSQVENAFKTNIFLPTAIKHGFKEITKAELDHKVRRPFKEREPILPDFDWRYKTNLLDDASFRELIVRLNQQVKLPMKIVSEVLGLDYDYIKSWMKKEEGTVFDPAYQGWRQALVRKPGKKGGSSPDIEFEERMRKGEKISEADIEREWRDSGKKDAWELDKMKGSLEFMREKGFMSDTQVDDVKDKITKQELEFMKPKGAGRNVKDIKSKEPMVSVLNKVKTEDKGNGNGGKPREFDFISRGGHHRKRGMLEAMFNEAKKAKV